MKFPPGHNRIQSLIASFRFLKDPISMITANMALFNGTYSGFLLGNKKFIITEDPGFIQHVLKDNHTNYQKSELSTKTAAKLFGKGLLFNSGEPWRRQRRLIQPAFHHGKIQSLNEIVAHTVNACISEFPTGTVEIYPLMRSLSFSVLVHSIFNLDLENETVKQLSDGFTDLQDFLLKDINEPFRRFLYPFNGQKKAILQKSANIRKVIREMIVSRKEEEREHHDLLDMLLNSRYEDNGELMEEEQVIDEILVLLFAGHETTANSLSWILYLLAEHPDTAQKLKKAIRGSDIYSGAKDEFINAVISEGMRMFPAAWMTERAAIKDDHFENMLIPKGTIVIPYFYGLHRNARLWSFAGEFRPERFMGTDGSVNKKTKYFFPFGAGPRMCVGNHFAIMEMAFILHAFFNRFEISSTGRHPGLWALITLRPRGLFLHIKESKPGSPEPDPVFEGEFAG